MPTPLPRTRQDPCQVVLTWSARLSETGDFREAQIIENEVTANRTPGTFALAPSEVFVTPTNPASKRIVIAASWPAMTDNIYNSVRDQMGEALTDIPFVTVVSPAEISAGRPDEVAMEEVE